MAIQFHCTGCSQPIEVDEEFAGRAAACPYCQRVVTVPATSTIEPQSAVVARPMSGVPQHGPTVDPLADLSRRQAAAYGNYSLICTGLMLVLCVVFFVRTMNIAFSLGLLRAGETPSASDQKRLMEAVGGDALVIGPAYGALFFALFGLVLGVASIRRAARANWRGITSCIVCGLYVLCQCGGVLTMMGGGAAGG